MVKCLLGFSGRHEGADEMLFKLHPHMRDH
jgi:hypothetical protein